MFDLYNQFIMFQIPYISRQSVILFSQSVFCAPFYSAQRHDSFVWCVRL